MTSDKLQALIDSGMSMEKTDVEPPEYRFSLRGQSKVVRVPLGAVHNRDKVDLMCWGAWDIHALADFTREEWRQTVDEWIGSGKAKTIDTGGTDLSSTIIRFFKRFIDQRGEGEEYSDLTTGSYVRRIQQGEDCYCFLPDPFFRWLPKNINHPVKRQDIEFALRQVGLRTGRDINPIRLGENSWRGRTWVLPCDQLDAFDSQEPEEQPELPETEEIPDL